MAHDCRYRELNKEIPPLFGAMPNTASLLDQLIHELGTYYYVLDLASAAFSIGLHPNSQDEFAFTWEGHQWTFIVLPQDYLHSPTVWHGLVAAWTTPSSMKLYHCIDDIMLTSDSLTELEHSLTTLELLCCWLISRAEDGQRIPTKSRDLDYLSNSWVLFDRVRQR